MNLIIFLEIITIILTMILFFLIKKYKPSKKTMIKKLKNEISKGEAILIFLTELCNVPLKNSVNFEDILHNLNNGKKNDSPYYGFGHIELINMVKEGYVAFWDANQDEMNQPDEKRSIIATPKAFELVEVRKSNIISTKATKISFFTGMMAVAVAVISLLLSITKGNALFALFGGLLVTLFLANALVKEL